MPRKLAAGNWKMNGTATSLNELQGLAHPDVDVLICPPALIIAQAVAECADTSLHIGAQDCHTAASGAHTGDISAEMVAAVGATHVILGHSERRADHGETSNVTRAKTEAAYRAGLIAIVCIGETLAEREAGQTLDVLTEQLATSLPDAANSGTTVVAYEPVWAIGTGLTASAAQIAEVHAHLRDRLNERFADDGAAFSILYGGSVKAANAAEIFATPNVNGALVGGASLKAADFRPIVEALAGA